MSLRSRSLPAIILVLWLGSSPIASAALSVRPASAATGEPDSVVLTVADRVAAGTARVVRNLTFEKRSTLRQLQPTKLKQVSRKKEIIIVAVIITGAVVIAYVIAIRKLHLVFHSLHPASP
jgi:hypothetical protein